MLSAVHEINGIFICRGGLPPGPPIALESIKQSLASGELSPEQLAWCRGLPDWMPVSEVIGFYEKKQVTSARQAPAPAVPQAVMVREPERPTGLPQSKLDRAISWLSRGGKKKVTAEELGDELWSFVKQGSRQFTAMLEAKLRENNVPLDEWFQFNVSQESTMLHLWMVNRFGSVPKKAIEFLNRRYALRLGRLAESYPDRENQIEFARRSKETFFARFENFKTLWNFQSPKAQTVIAAYVLDSMLDAQHSCTKTAEHFMVTHISNALAKFAPEIPEFCSRFEISD